MWAEVGSRAARTGSGRVFAAYLFVMTPVLNTLTRTAEYEADVFGLCVLILGGMRGSTGTQPFVGQRDHGHDRRADAADALVDHRAGALARVLFHQIAQL